MKILLDTNIIWHAVTHATELVPHELTWGPHELTVEVAQRVHKRLQERHKESITPHLPYLATLCTSVEEGRVEFFTSHELQMEELRQEIPSEGCLGINMLQGVPLKKARCPIQRPLLIGATASIGITEVEQMDFFRSIQHPRFLHIRKAVGEAHVDDAFHLWTAEEASLDVFLTLDKRFRNVVYNQRNNIKSVVLVMMPKQLCEHLGMESSDIEILAGAIHPFS